MIDMAKATDRVALALSNGVPDVYFALSNLAATSYVSSAGAAQVALSWDNSADNESNYLVQREDLSDANPTWTTIATNSPDVTSAMDTSLNSTHQYEYRVVAANGDA